jgi:hypothetical protein
LILVHNVGFKIYFLLIGCGIYPVSLNTVLCFNGGIIGAGIAGMAAGAQTQGFTAQVLQDRVEAPATPALLLAISFQMAKARTPRSAILATVNIGEGPYPP